MGWGEGVCTAAIACFLTSAESPAVTTPIEATQHWLQAAVIGLNLCPFAKAVHAKGQIRWVQSDARDTAALREDLRCELLALAAADPQVTDTTVLVHPLVLTDFLDFNDFLAEADELLAELALDGVLQVASFHPDYRFAGVKAKDISHFSNRSPHPTLHLLREDSVDRAVATTPDAAEIYERNIDTLRALGPVGWSALGITPGESLLDAPQPEVTKPAGITGTGQA